jgi:hypothetical protein
LIISTGQSGHGRELRQPVWFVAAARVPKDHWELPDVGHGEGLTKHPAEYAQRVLGFFATALLAQMTSTQP